MTLKNRICLKQYSKNEKTQILVAVGLIMAIIVPFLILCKYASPFLDDFAFAWNGDLFAESIGANGFFERLWAPFICGQYIGNFLNYSWSTLVPLYQYNYIMLWFIIFFFIAVFILVFTIFKYILKTKKINIILWFYTAIILLLTQFVNPKQVFYYITCLDAYLLPTIMLALFVAAFIKTLNAPKINVFWMILSVLLCAVATIFGSVITAVMVSLVALFIGWYAFQQKIKYRYLVLIMVAIAVICTVFNMTDITRIARIDSGTQGGTDISGILNGLIMSFSRTALQIQTYFTTYPLLAILILLVPFMIHICRKMNFSFKWPFFPIIVSVLMYTASVFPYVYGDGGYKRFESRIEFCMLFLFVFMTFFNAFYLCGWLVKKYDIAIAGIYKKLGVLALALVFWCISFSIIPLNKYNSYQIGIGIGTGEVQETKAEHMRFFDTLYLAPEGSDVSLENPKGEFELLPRISLVWDPAVYRNFVYARYFGLSSLTRNDEPYRLTDLKDGVHFLIEKLE